VRQLHRNLQENNRDEASERRVRFLEIELAPVARTPAELPLWWY